MATQNLLLWLLLTGAAAVTAHDGQSDSFDADAALRQSQVAVGRQIPAYQFTDASGQAVSLADYRGMPVVISLIYSSCYHTCPVTTQYLKKAIGAAREALGGRPFQVLSIGFDVPADNPRSMAGFKHTQAVQLDHWAFLSGDRQTIAALTRDLGFSYRASPRGYDHLVQLSVLDEQGVLYRQVYGETYELPWLVEPLKEIVFKDRRGIRQLLSNIGNRVRLFCTLYDPVSGRYRYDYSLFIQMTIGGMVIIAGIIYLVREARRAQQLKAGKSA